MDLNDDTALFDEVVDELARVILESIEDDEGFQAEVIAITGEIKDFAAGERNRCEEHWKGLYAEAVEKIRVVCRKAGL